MAAVDPRLGLLLLVACRVRSIALALCAAETEQLGFGRVAVKHGDQAGNEQEKRETGSSQIHGVLRLKRKIRTSKRKV
jgi:hypothetical protein